MHQKILETLRETLPPLFTRAEASRFLGGLYSAGTLANLDCIGKGAGGTRVGRKIVYEKDSFILWLEKRFLASKSEAAIQKESCDE